MKLKRNALLCFTMKFDLATMEQGNIQTVTMRGGLDEYTYSLANALETEPRLSHILQDILKSPLK